ncbi:hypothetical protein FKM82_023173 [Ascaphus truei]
MDWHKRKASTYSLDTNISRGGNPLNIWDNYMFVPDGIEVEGRTFEMFKDKRKSELGNKMVRIHEEVIIVTCQDRTCEIDVNCKQCAVLGLKNQYCKIPRIVSGKQYKEYALWKEKQEKRLAEI